MLNRSRLVRHVSNAPYVKPRFRDLAGVVPGAFIALLLASGSGAAATVPVDPSGLWYTKDSESIIKIAPCGVNFCGTIAWLKEPNEKDGTPKLDSNNSDVTKQTQPMVGLEILLDLNAEKDHWTGKAYNPDDGKTYDITFKVNADKKVPETAVIRGCLLIFCQSETFTRAAALPKAPGTASIPKATGAPAAATPAKR